jgi:hypothetical protein
MRFDTASTERGTSSCNVEGFRISSAPPLFHTMSAWRRSLKPVLAGLFVTFAQLAVAVCLLAPEGPLSYRYSSLVQHDGYWFMNIVDRGYATTVPPINHKVMEVSNVAFFPAYPVFAAALHHGFGFEIDNSLLVAAEAAALGFWSYFFLFCERWGVSASLQALGALSVAAHPAAFFLIAGYSESLFLMALIGFMYWSTGQGRVATILAALHGIMMSATRIVGIPCAAFPVVQSVFAKGLDRARQPLAWLQLHLSSLRLMIAATLGAGLFFVYCQLRWGHWDMYMLTQSAGWGITPDYLAVFRPSSYRWLLPALNNPTQASQMAMTAGALALVLAGFCEVVAAAIRRRTHWEIRVGFYFCAAIVYFVSVSGVACVEMESMLRYQFCVHALIVLAFLNFLRQFRNPPLLLRVLGVAGVALGSAAGLGVQGWFVWNFTRGNWVA